MEMKQNETVLRQENTNAGRNSQKMIFSPNARSRANPIGAARPVENARIRGLSALMRVPITRESVE
jgi:hypothetical protein